MPALKKQTTEDWLAGTTPTVQQCFQQLVGAAIVQGNELRYWVNSTYCAVGNHNGRILMAL